MIHVQIRNLYDFSHKNLVVAKFVEITETCQIGDLMHVQIRNLYDFSHRNLVVTKPVEITENNVDLT